MATAVDQILATLTELKTANPEMFADFQKQVKFILGEGAVLPLTQGEEPFDYDKAMAGTLGSVNTSGLGVTVSAPVLTQDGVDRLAAQMVAGLENREAAVQAALAILSVALACA